MTDASHAWIAIALASGLASSACGSGIHHNPPGDPATPPGDTAAPPPAPTGLTATPGHHQVVLSWTASPGATTYRAYWANTAGVTRATGTAIDALASPLLHSDLENGTTYHYVVTAIGPGGESADSDEVSAVPALLPPSSVSAVAGNARITVYWTAVAGATGHNLYWSTSAGVTIETGTQIPSAVSPYSHTGLANGTTHFYVVTSSDGLVESSASVEASATPRLPAPANLTGTPGDGEVNLQWEAVAGATGYNLYWSLDPGVSPIAGTAIASVTSPHTHSGLANGTVFYYVVTAVDATSEGPPSESVTVRPGPPDAPAGVAASAGYERVTITWSPVTGATGYNLYWSNSSPVVTDPGNRIVGATSPYVHQGLVNGTTYHYVVTAMGPGGESAASTEVQAVPALLPPAGLTAVAGNGEITLTWLAVMGATSYALYWSNTPGVNPSTGTVIPAATSPQLHTGLANGTTHYYVVTASDGIDQSAPSSVASATPRLPAPAALAVAPGDGEATLTWEPVPGATSHRLYWSTSPGVSVGSGTLIPSVTSPFVHQGLANGTPHYWVATAADANDESDTSNEVGTTPGPRLLAFRVDLAGGQSQTYLVRMAGASPGPPLFLANGNGNARFDFTLDGSKLWYHANTTSDAPLNLFVADTTSGTIGTVYQVNGAVQSVGVARARFAPDGSWLAYEADELTADQHDLYLADTYPLPPGSPFRLTTGAASGSPADFFFSPDSTRLFFSTFGGQLFCVDLTGDPTAVRPVSGPANGVGGVTEAEVGRDGTTFAYLADLETGGLIELYVGTLGNGCDSQYHKVQTSDAVSSLALAPGADAVAFLSGGDLYLVATDSPASPDAVNTSGVVGAYAWAPDGTFLAYRADQQTSGVEELFRATVTGASAGTPAKLNGNLTNGGDVTAFAVSRDRARVVYRADQRINDVPELFVVDTSGATPGAAFLINAALTTGGRVTGFAIAPDSSSVLYVARANAGSAEGLFWTEISAATPGVPIELTPSANPNVTLGGQDPDFDLLANAFALDGAFGLYLGDHEVIDRPELWVVEVDGPGAPVKVNAALSSGGVGWFRWAPLHWAVRDWEP